MENRRAHLEIHLAEPDSGMWLFDRFGGNRFWEKGILRHIDGKGSFDTFWLLIYFGQDDDSGDLEIVDDGLVVEGQMGQTSVGELTADDFRELVKDLARKIGDEHELAVVRFWRIGENGEHLHEHVQNTFDSDLNME